MDVNSYVGKKSWLDLTYKNTHKLLKSIKLSHFQSAVKENCRQQEHTFYCWIEATGFLFYWICKKTMTFLEKMIMDYNNGLHILPGSKKNIFFTTNMFLQVGLKTWDCRKPIPDTLVTRKLIPKEPLGCYILTLPN